MDFLAKVASWAALAISLLLAVRLLRMARRTGNAPEMAMGAYEAFIVLGMAAYISTRFVPGDGVLLVFRLVVAANFLIACGVVALAFGVWRIYRAAEAWPKLVCAGLALWVLGSWAWTSAGEGLPLIASSSAANTVFVAGRTAVYAWGAFEAFRFHHQLRRRLALGLIEPLVVHQVLLWGVFCVCMGMTAVVMLASGYVLGDAVRSWRLGTLINAGLSFSASYCLWFSFFPPAFYRRRFIWRTAVDG